ncbi:MAG TPA: Hsp20/alpha crystallin family protein [Symbiobacteriaceae bacterium]|nr:Hsp20/alpha crystallin family protein [Symbiobacteriaceae bacterium]
MQTPTPTDAMRQLAEQMGWLQQFMGEDFWNQVSQAARPGQGAAGARPGAAGAPPQRAAAGMPPVEVYATATEVVVTALLPGLSGPDQVAVSLATPLELVIEAVLPGPAPGAVTLHRECPSGYCARTVTLPAAISPTGVRAAYIHGCLELRLPRTEPGPASHELTLLQVPRA